jgi:hypothetical protein
MLPYFSAAFHDLTQSCTGFSQLELPGNNELNCTKVTSCFAASGVL